MPDFLSIIPESHQNISFGYMEVLIQEHRQELFSGLMRISYPAGENFVFIFLEGVQQSLYHCFESTTEVVNRQTWSQVLNRPDASVGFLPLGVDGLRIFRVTHEAPVQALEQFNLTAPELVERMLTWAESPAPGFVYIQSGDLQRIDVLAGAPNQTIEELIAAKGQVGFSVSEVGFTQTLPTADYKVFHYLSLGESDIWHEYKLRLAFQPLMRLLVTRFSELAGRALAERLGGQLTDWVTNGGWNLNINGSGVINREFFDSTKEALEVYTGILQRFREEAGLAVGPRLVENMFRETLMKLPSLFRNILNQYLPEQFGFGSTTVIAQKEGSQL